MLLLQVLILLLTMCSVLNRKLKAVTSVSSARFSAAVKQTAKLIWLKANVTSSYQMSEILHKKIEDLNFNDIIGQS